MSLKFKNAKVIFKPMGWLLIIGLLILLALVGGFLAANNQSLVTFALGEALLCL